MLRSAVALAFDAAAFDAAIVAGQGPALLADLQERFGIAFDDRLPPQVFLRLQNGQAPRFRKKFAEDGAFTLVCDAQPELVTVGSAGVPAYLSNVLDPRTINVLVSPMKAAQIYGETQRGDWLTTTVQWKVRELTGEVSSYGDYSNNGNSGANLNFPVSQAYHYQTMSQWGQREAANAGLAAVDWASSINEASILVLNKFQNQSYFYGISGLQTYGALNHPDLFAPIVATAGWNLAGTSAETIYEDIRRLFVQIQVQTGGLVDANARMKLVMSNVIQPALNKTNQYNVNVYDQLRKNFPNMSFDNAVEFANAPGELVQLIVESVEGQPTATCAFTEKLRSHNMVVKTSSFEQKKSQGTLGFVLFWPPGIAQMTGV